MLKQLSWRLFICLALVSPVCAHAEDARMTYVTLAGNTQALGMAAAICGVDGHIYSLIVFSSGTGARAIITWQKEN